MGKSIRVKFKASPVDQTPNCTLQIDWSNVNIENLCILISVEKTGDSVFSFLSLNALDDSTTLTRTRTDVKSGPFTIYVYGLERTQRRTPYFYKACAGAKKTLTYTAGESNEWKLDLQEHSLGSLSMTSHKDIVGQDLFTMKQNKASRFIRLTSEDVDLPANVLMVLKEQDEDNEMFWLTASLTKSFIKIPFDVLAPGSSLVKLYTLKKVSIETGLMIYKKSASSKEMEIKSKSSPTPTKQPDLTCEQMETLMEKAKNYVSRRPERYEISHVYRNKPPFYYHSIVQLHDGIMETYHKDYNGDSASCINGTIDGLFFSTCINIRTKKLPSFSFFGAKRLEIPPEYLIKNDCNLYFADFYCHYEHHYITVVVTKSGSQTDIFCERKLIKLDPRTNPFICTNNFKLFSVTMSAYVELFYTEDINITSLLKEKSVSFSRVSIRGRGESKKYGIPKKENCAICHV